MVSKYRNNFISSKYPQYRTAGIETESPGIEYRKQQISRLSLLEVSAKHFSDRSLTNIFGSGCRYDSIDESASVVFPSLMEFGR